VKRVAHLGRARDPDVLRQNGIQRAPQFCHIPSIRHPHSNRLTARVHPGALKIAVR